MADSFCFTSNSEQQPGNLMSKASSVKTKGKLTKKELKQDKLVQYTYQVEAFYNKHRQWVIGVVVGILVIIAGVILVRRMIESSRLETAYQLTMAKMSYGSGRYDEAKEAFQKIVNSSGGSPAAEAKYFLGRVAFEQGDFPQAEAQFREFLRDFSGNTQLDIAARAGLASILETQSKQEEAISMYEKIVEKYPSDAFCPQALSEISRIYLRSNQKDKAIEVLKRILNEYPESASASKARQKLASFE